MKQTILILATFSFLLSCKKTNDTQTPVNPSDKKVARLDHLHLSNSFLDELNTIAFSQNVGTTVQSLGGYEVKPDGAYRIEFHGQNGAMNLFRGRSRGMSSTGVTLDISARDTIMIFQISDNSLFRTYIFNPVTVDSVDRSLYIAKRFSNFSEQQTIDYGNSFVIDSFPTLKFKRNF
jgi:hypothetical protein